MSNYFVSANAKVAAIASLLVLGSLACSSASAVCVNSVPVLKTVLLQGMLSTQPLTIQLVQGTYLMDADVHADLAGPTTIEGGYLPGCASRAVDAANTVIDIGPSNFFELTQEVGSPAKLSIDGLTFTHTAQFAGFFAGNAAHPGSLNISRSRFTNIGGNGTYALQFSSRGGVVTLENVVLDNMFTSLPFPNNCAVVTSLLSGASGRFNHVTASFGTNNDACFITGASGGGTLSIYNSILWTSAPQSSIFRELPDSNLLTATIANSIYKTPAFNSPLIQLNSISTDPLWTNPVDRDYHLQSGSPAVNSGTSSPPGGETATDIESRERIIGSAPDRGAYESLISDQSSFVVSNTNDSGAGSLRDAITLANGNLGQRLITFNIRNQANVPVCPAVIGLTSVLPTITSRVTIDGYTQPLSTKNTSADAFNANLCVIVKPASGTLNNAFTVPPDSFASLVLRGLGIGGFSQPVRILGGQNSQISGNQFGGTATGVVLPGASFNAITFAAGASGNIIVGGNALGDRNVIGLANFSGIDSETAVTSSFTTCQIVNNIVGLAPDGISPLPNNVGILVGGTGCYVVGNRLAGNIANNLWIQGDHNVIQQNSVGFNIQNQGFASLTTGIRITGSNNVIGASGNGGSISANTVRFGVIGGVVVKGDGAVGNSINANRIYENGAGGNRVDIDLVTTAEVAGPTPNDPGDLDSGPNDIQNFPVPKVLAYTGPGTNDRPAMLTALLDTIPGSYRVDVYFSNAINTLGNRGQAEIILTNATVQVPASGKLTFSVPISVPNQSAGGVISLTATNSEGGTSEISTALSTDRIFADGVD